MKKDFTAVKETIVDKPAMILNGHAVPAHHVRTLTLGHLQVTANSTVEGYDVNISRGSERIPWIAAHEWDVFKIMVESQFAWGESHKKGGE